MNNPLRLSASFKKAKKYAAMTAAQKSIEQ